MLWSQNVRAFSHRLIYTLLSLTLFPHGLSTALHNGRDNQRQEQKNNKLKTVQKDTQLPRQTSLHLF